jgi:hypothetical protein
MRNLYFNLLHNANISQFFLNFLVFFFLLQRTGTFSTTIYRFIEVKNLPLLFLSLNVC